MRPDLDEYYMSLALELAKKGVGKTSPNPMVGAVIVKNNEVIGRGWHERYGGPHAEVNAIINSGDNLENSVLYVTLEPCCHYGKQPPCTSKIIESGISRVVVGCTDPNPDVSGKGIQILEDYGIAVTVDVLREKCEKLNEIFFHYIRTGLPFVMMKYAMTVDGKIAAYTGTSQWITQEEARKNVHRDRNRYSAIMVGAGTVIADNPMLTCRLPDTRNPVRIICDTNLRIPLTSNVVQTANTVPTILATASTDTDRRKTFESCGCRILGLPKDGEYIDLRILIQELGSQGIDSIMLEGGAELNWSALQSGLVNRIQTYVGAKLFGGKEARSPIEGKGFSDSSASVSMKLINLIRFGEDCLLEYNLEPKSEEEEGCLQG